MLCASQPVIINFWFENLNNFMNTSFIKFTDIFIYLVILASSERILVGLGKTEIEILNGKTN